MSDTKIITGKVRGSYVNVFEPKENKMSGVVEYSMAILIPKSDKETVKKINAAAKAAADKKWNGKPPANIRMPLRDADAEAEADGREVDPNYAGHYFMNLKSKDAPGIVDARRQQVIDPKEFMSGDYCRVSMNAYAYDMKGNKGVSFGLNNVQVLAKGEPLGKARAEDDFDEFEDDAEDLF